MDELTKQQQLDDIVKLYELLCRAGQGGDVWLQVVHGRTKTLTEKTNIQNPLFSAYKEAKEKETQSMQADIDELRAENDSLKKELEKLKEANSELSFYMDLWKQRTTEREAEAQSYLDYAAELEQEKEKKRQSMVCNGKALELPPRVIKEVIRQWCLGGKIKQIQSETGASRGQIERIVKADLKHKESRKKVLKCINHLLKVNQNQEYIDKLKALKTKYE